jgi:hypothetical protein
MTFFFLLATTLRVKSGSHAAMSLLSPDTWDVFSGLHYSNSLIFLICPKVHMLKSTTLRLILYQLSLIHKDRKVVERRSFSCTVVWYRVRRGTWITVKWAVWFRMGHQSNYRSTNRLKGPCRAPCILQYIKTNFTCLKTGKKETNVTKQKFPLPLDSDLINDKTGHCSLI